MLDALMVIVAVHEGIFALDVTAMSGTTPENWRDQFDVVTFDIRSGEHCVLGQTHVMRGGEAHEGAWFAEAERVRNEMMGSDGDDFWSTVDWARYHGFSACHPATITGPTDPPHVERRWSMLEDAWRGFAHWYAREKAIAAGVIKVNA